MNDPQRSLRRAAIGTAVLVLCVFTPILTPLLGAVGAGALVPWLDWLLLPVLAFFVAWLLVALRQRVRVHAEEEHPDAKGPVVDTTAATAAFG